MRRRSSRIPRKPAFSSSTPADSPTRYAMPSSTSPGSPTLMASPSCTSRFPCADCLRSRRRIWFDLRQHFLELCSCARQFVARLQFHPEVRRRPEETRQPDRQLRRHPAALTHHLAHLLIGHTYPFGKHLRRQPHGRKKLLPQHTPGMHGSKIFHDYELALVTSACQ